MAVDQLAVGVREFAGYLNGLVARLDPGGGWYAVFRHRDPEGMRACLDGWEVPPWDVVEALLHDLAGAYGPAAAARETERARSLHRASVAAHDLRPGARASLGGHLDAMLHEQRRAAGRTAELGRLLESAATREEAEVLRVKLAWAQDDHARATARCAELRARLEDLDRRAAPEGRSGGGDVAPTPVPAPAPAPSASNRPEPEPRPRRRPRGSARFAGMMNVLDATAATAAAEEAEAAPAAAAPAVTPPGARAPRGARFAGATQEPVRPARPPEPRQPSPLDDEARHEIDGTVGTLLALRRGGRGGEAHALLAELAHWPAARFPPLAAALYRAGPGADWATLLWEAASLPAGRLAAVADALAGAGRGADGERLLRQGVARPAGEIGDAVLGLADEGRGREARALLDAYVRARPPEETARSAAADPRRLVPLLLEAASEVSEPYRRHLVHALRVTGLTA
ncbi:hypothetical protein GCM10010368_13010 [Streptomyces roseiscleroticus]|uniref:UL36 very large tegument protein n=1 Tax=Streptomyces roseiscleroticus TaxID=1972 RepID=A0ABP5R0T0_9ACTN